MQSQVHIRQATLQDLSQVQQFSQNTFSWGDYLPSAWERWVRSARGDLLVAEIDGIAGGRTQSSSRKERDPSQVIGTIHVRYLENQEAWLEGVRVRHEFRQRGIASEMICAAHERARAKKCRVIRLETSAKNLGARRAFEKFGYRLLVEYATYRASAEDNERDNARLAQTRDINSCWELWQRSFLKRASRTVVPAPYGWRWYELTRTRLADEIKNARVYAAARAFMILREMNAEGLDLTLLAGAKRDALSLLSAARGLAKQRGKENAFWLTPHIARAQEWAAQAGYTLDEDGILIYACEL